MISYEDYLNFMQENVLAEIVKLDNSYANAQVTIENITKNNDVTHQVLCVKRDNDTVVPQFRMHENYAYYIETGKDLDVLVKEMAEHYIESVKNARDVAGMTSVVSDWNAVKSMIFPRLTNREKSQDFLDKKVFFPFEDMAVLFYIDFENVHATVIVTEDIFAKWGISRDELKKQAIANMTPDTMLLIPIGDMLAMMPGDDDDDREKVIEQARHTPFFIATKYDMQYGAAAMLCNPLLKSLSDTFDDDVAIIPSSVHEIIAIPMGLYGGDKDDDNCFIQKVNKEMLSKQEVLSDHMYVWRKDTQSIETF